MSILRNGNVACLCHLFSPMSHVEFKTRLCHMSLYFYSLCRIPLSPMSHVKLKKCPSRPVNFRGQGPNGSRRQPAIKHNQRHRQPGTSRPPRQESMSKHGQLLLSLLILPIFFFPTPFLHSSFPLPLSPYLILNLSRHPCIYLTPIRLTSISRIPPSILELLQQFPSS